MTTEHTPTPWWLLEEKHDDFGDMYRIAAANMVSPGLIFRGLGEETEANARLVILAVNNHDKLVEALRGLVAIAGDGAEVLPELKNARAVLAEVEHG